jgi:hypothetical protein
VGSREVQYGILQEESKVNGMLMQQSLVIAEKQKVRKLNGTRRTLIDYYALLSSRLGGREGRDRGKDRLRRSNHEDAVPERGRETV